MSYLLQLLGRGLGSDLGDILDRYYWSPQSCSLAELEHRCVQAGDDVDLHLQLGLALANMTQQLRDTMAENQRESWFKTGQSELNDRMRGELSMVDLAQNVITQLASYVDAQIGAIFLAEDDQTLKLVSSYAYTRRKGISNEFSPGQGLVGQALMEKKTIIVFF